MIKFFRHIRLRLLTQESAVVNTKEEASADKVRQRMIKENPTSANASIEVKKNEEATAGTRVSKYMLYAIGEIILVMVGILLALQVSTWNQERQARKKEQVLLYELNLEFKGNKAQLEEVVSKHERALEAAQNVISEFPIDITTLDLDSFRLKRQGINTRYTFNPSQGIINSLVNTSSFDLISDSELRKLLVSWNDVLADYQEEELIASKILIDRITPFMAKHLSFHGGYHSSKTDLSVLESREYENWTIIRAANLRDILGNGEDENELTKIQDSIDRIIELSEAAEE